MKAKMSGNSRRFAESVGFGPALLMAVGGLGLPDSAMGSYHFMQIEQVVGGVNGNTAAQAIQLRMRVDSQSQLENARLYAVDAAGENPVLLMDFGGSVAGAAARDRVLAVTEDLARYTVPELQADYVLSAPIPTSFPTLKPALLAACPRTDGTMLSKAATAWSCCV